MNLKINEIFGSIQGEGLDTGRPCTMIRLTGCNLRCSYCDTEYAFTEGTEMDIDEVVKKTEKFNNKIVEVTGGEPLYQRNTVKLVEKLLDRGFKTLIETNGSYRLDDLDKRSIKIMDIKTPSSGMEKFNIYPNLSELKGEDQLKFVISDKNDFDFSCDLIKKSKLNIDGGNIFFSPVFNKINLQEFAQWIIDSGLDIRMQVQLHKVVWPEDMRGV